MHEFNDVEFRMKILSSHYSAFNRQIAEAVKIKRNEGKYLLNSRSEYNRSSLPAIKVNEKKSEWELSEIADDELEKGIAIIEEYKENNNKNKKKEKRLKT